MTAPRPDEAVMPSEEEIARVIRDWHATPAFDGWDAQVADLTGRIITLFAPILAEKERAGRLAGQREAAEVAQRCEDQQEADHGAANTGGAAAAHAAIIALAFADD